MAKSKKPTKSTNSKTTETKVRRVEADGGDGGSFWRNVIIIALIILGLFFMYNVFSDNSTKENKEDEAKDSKVEEKDKKEADKKTEDTTTKVQSNQTSVKETDKSYEFTVGAGESYTTVARQAVANVDSKLNSAQRVAAETKIVQEAGAGLLNQGQDLTINKDAIRSAVDWAKSLSEAEQAAWQPYADLVAW